MLRFLCAMGIFGTIGLFVRWVDLPSSAIVLWRGIFGSIALYALMRLAGRQLNVEAIRKNGLRLLFTGVFLSANWIFLFEAYNRTSIATATLLYYMAPVLLILVSPLLLKERITPFKFVCVLFALLGMALVSGFPGASFDGNWDGVLCGILSAVFYTALILNNKFLKDLPDDDLVIAQLGVAALLTLPYVLATEDVTSFSRELPRFSLSGSFTRRSAASSTSRASRAFPHSASRSSPTLTPSWRSFSPWSFSEKP